MLWVCLVLMWAAARATVLKNLDYHSVFKDHDSSTKFSGETNPRLEESRKNQNVWRDSHLSAENEKKANPDVAFVRSDARYFAGACYCTIVLFC
jgi:hypothetical protein